MEASIIAINEVGIRTWSIPLLKTDARKPPRSVIIPPPKHSNRLSLSAWDSSIAWLSSPTMPKLLLFSPTPISRISVPSR